jgi:hypothetical protein
MTLVCCFCLLLLYASAKVQQVDTHTKYVIKFDANYNMMDGLSIIENEVYKVSRKCRSGEVTSIYIQYICRRSELYYIFNIMQ